MDYIPEEQLECKVRLDVAMDILALSSSRLMGVIPSEPSDAVDSARLDLRIARLRFLVARDECRECLFISSATC